MFATTGSFRGERRDIYIYEKQAIQYIMATSQEQLPESVATLCLMIGWSAILQEMIVTLRRMGWYPAIAPHVPKKSCGPESLYVADSDYSISW